MKILAKTGKDDLAIVYIAELDSGAIVEFVRSLQPPYPIEKKWVLIVSTLNGCPSGCKFCDSGVYYKGKLTEKDILEQIDYLVLEKFPDRFINSDKFKIQFARMGDPAMNEAVLNVIERLPEIYNASGLIPSVSTIAPKGFDSFFKKLLKIKEKQYKERFQLQFSIHSTDLKQRDWLMPIKKWDFQAIADYGKYFFNGNGNNLQNTNKKIALNFALAAGIELNPNVLTKYFNPDIFIIKLTPVNPTFNAVKNGIKSGIMPGNEHIEIMDRIKEEGYDVILSIGELEENQIGSNCGQHILNYQKNNNVKVEGYSYELEVLSCK